MNPVTVTVLSIGLNPAGNSVMRVRFGAGEQVDVPINVASFAKLAAKGVRVYNEMQQRAKR